MCNFINNEVMIYVDGLRKLNTITKYPSILTYHNLGPKGSLVDSLVEERCFENKPIFITEKIDGTNSRIVFITGEHGEVVDYIIGSREELLFAFGDRIINPALGVVNNLKPIADAIMLLSDGNVPLHANSMYCLYGETYGGNINGAKQYSGHGTYGIRFFDMWQMPLDHVLDLMEMPIDRISNWREHDGQPFARVDVLEMFCDDFGLERVPYIRETVGTEIPNDLQGVWDWMQEFASSTALIDNDGKGMSEGVVVRYADRSLIRKIRFEDYMRTKKLGLIK